MYKLVLAVFFALVAFVAAKPSGGAAYVPVAYSYGSPVAYSAPVGVAYSGYGSPLAYSGYGSPLAYSGYSPYVASPVAYASSPYSFYLKR